ncbi:ferrous iron transport protein B [Desulfonauticus submarinus]|uniref:Ferrous iron transport protein B n=1 Tax=Desulfonauticus submarinus TaxID=206665 RepID=A0A1H0DZI2_9BACT|nr:ferrous iron transport protein B [Desulfonauticus submarinus]SDN75446.1 ferrous iron transport protein B [Desulfonauticus submarinus]
MNKKTVLAALAGNPNSGKTTLFNLLTGARQRVGNYPGVTVEKKEGSLAYGDKVINFVDLPGAYSLTAYSEEELVARRFILEENPDAVVQVIDSTVLERSLYLTVQLMEMGASVVLALNMIDEAEKKGITINEKQLSSLLGVPVVKTVAKTGRGKQELVQTIVELGLGKREGTNRAQLVVFYGEDVELAIKQMLQLMEKHHFLETKYPLRWVAIKYLENDEEIIKEGNECSLVVSEQLLQIRSRLEQHIKETLGTDIESVIADYRYGYIASLLKQGVLKKEISSQQRRSYSEQIDMFLTHKVLGPVVMLLVLYGLFQLTFLIGEIPMGWLESFFGWLGDTATNLIPEGFLQSLVVSGIIDGVGGVMGFVPLILVMFIGISFLEDLGYMARMAYMLDRVFRFFGLHGSSVMPFIVSGGIPGGCAVPGVMATRTLRSPKEKLATVLVSPFLVCGAKVPVFILLAAAFFPNNGANVLFWITLFAWAMALITAMFLRSTVIKGASTPFLMELPPYRLPSIKGVLIHAWERAWMYIKKAGTVILGISVLVWASMTFPQLPQEKLQFFEQKIAALEQQMQAASTEADREELKTKIVDLEDQLAEASLENSFAGRLGKFLEPVSRWAGFNWKTNIALIGGFAAKEVIVSTLGTAYSLGEVDPEEAEPLVKQLQADPQWSKAVAISLIVFVLLYAPCFVTVVAMAKETSWKWAIFGVFFNTSLAFALSVLVYRLLFNLI